MKIQISQTKVIKDALVIWNEHGPEVDIVMDLKNLSFKEGSIEEIYSFHVLDHFFPEEVPKVIANWRKCLQTGSVLFTVVDDFEYVARAFVGGDLSIDLLNNVHNHPTQFTRDSLTKTLRDSGFKDTDSHVWFADVPGKFEKKHYELVFESKKI